MIGFYYKYDNYVIDFYQFHQDNYEKQRQFFCRYITKTDLLINCLCIS